MQSIVWGNVTETATTTRLGMLCACDYVRQCDHVAYHWRCVYIIHVHVHSTHAVDRVSHMHCCPNGNTTNLCSIMGKRNKIKTNTQKKAVQIANKRQCKTISISWVWNAKKKAAAVVLCCTWKGLSNNFDLDAIWCNCININLQHTYKHPYTHTHTELLVCCSVYAHMVIVKIEAFVGWSTNNKRVNNHSTIGLCVCEWDFLL